jgi:hypothetical protein
MPPAFNLSQDQTLQFNLCLLQDSLEWTQPRHPCGQPGLHPRTQSFSNPLQDQTPRLALAFRVSTKVFSETPRLPATAKAPKDLHPAFRQAPVNPSTHTYRLLIFKERLVSPIGVARMLRQNGTRCLARALDREKTAKNSNYRAVQGFLQAHCGATSSRMHRFGSSDGPEFEASDGRQI